VRGGLVTFFTMAYIIVLNPLIIAPEDADGHFLAVATHRTSPWWPRPPRWWRAC